MLKGLGGGSDCDEYGLLIGTHELQVGGITVATNVSLSFHVPRPDPTTQTLSRNGNTVGCRYRFGK